MANFTTKEGLAECIRVLAINVAYYESVYGELPLNETLAMAYAEEPNEAQVRLLTRGMETLVGVLGCIWIPDAEDRIECAKGVIHGYQHCVLEVDRVSDTQQNDLTKAIKKLTAKKCQAENLTT